MSAARNRRLPALLLAAVVLALTVGTLTVGAAPPASAHAVLEETDPADGATLAEPPAQVTLQFDEPVELVEGGLRVHDQDAARVDEGVIRRGEGGQVAVALPDDLPDGGYLVVYRVVSTDSHPINGVIGFTVGEGDAVDDALVGDLLGDNPVVGVVGSALRGLSYLGTLLAAGSVVFLLVIAGRDDDRRRARRVGSAAAVVGLVATILALPVQTMALAGVGLVDALGAASAQTLQSSFGESWVLRVVALGLLAPLVRRGGPDWALIGVALAAPASYLLDGHTRSVEPGWLLMVGDGVHLAAGAIWFAGLVLLALAVRARSVDDRPVDAARLVSRFSATALWTVIAVAVSGGVMGWVLVRAPDALVATGYGWTLVAKVTLVLLAVLVAAYNRSRLVPAVAARLRQAGASTDAPSGGSDVDEETDDARDDDGEPVRRRSRAAWRQLRTTLAVESVLLVVVLLVTGFLVVQRPAAEDAGVTGLYDTRVAMTEDLDVEVVVDPNRAGETNAIHLYVLDASGRPAGDVEEVRLELHYLPEDIGPFEVEPFPAGPGHWIANVDDLTFPGRWRLTVTAAVDRFDEEQVEIEVPVR